jgi:ribonuclease D
MRRAFSQQLSAPSPIPPPPVDYLHITTAEQLAQLCRQLADCDRIGFDTEFVSEDTFRPELGLVQVVSPHGLAIIDPQPIENLNPFWEMLADGRHTTIAHAAREEINFSLTAINRPPANLFDTQLASAFCSTEYPAAYSSVVTRFLGHRPNKGEQRTDWRRRPLSEDQISYALEDVRYLFELHDVLAGKIDSLGRGEWLDEEMENFEAEVIAARTRQRWRKVSGIGGMSPRHLAIVRELWLWRQSEAESRNVPPRRILRDDLLVEIAKRKNPRPDKIRAIRGMNYRSLKNSLDDIAAAIQRGLDASTDDLASRGTGSMPSQLQLLGQFLMPALTSICRDAQMAASLTGTASELRNLIAYRLGFGNFADIDDDSPEDQIPALARGWRAEFIGNLIDDLLTGRKSIRIENPRSEHPLGFVDAEGNPHSPQERVPRQKLPSKGRKRR